MCIIFIQRERERERDRERDVYCIVHPGLCSSFGGYFSALDVCRVVILKSVDSFHVEPSGLTLQAFMNQGPKNTQAASAFLREPSLSGFNTVTNIVPVQARAAEQGSSGSRPRRR